MVLDELSAWIAAGAGIGLVEATSLFYGEMPDHPAVADICAALVLYGGLADEHAMGTDDSNLEYPRFQVTVRHTDQDLGGKLCGKIKARLVAIVNETVGGVYYVNVEVVSPFTQVPTRDTKGRWSWLASFQATKHPSPTA